ncbi:ribonuclease H-like domain-containing protein [Rhizophagus clarus]|uniref:Ribonuclease H-like domain-containing protein n=1 Tax=Rhizophagus clarus TaxID=94130 RepID=A0A8H3LWJ9_9GLOM|nr:ribonuclease H-like domain-containing protein [Rhizophagus clarus]
MHSAKCNIKQKKKKIKQNRHLLYNSDLKRDLNMLKGMLNKIHRAKLDFNNRSIENRQKIITHITALHRRSDESKYINATYEYKKNMMDTFIQEKNQNYKTDKKKMIKSVLERPHTSLFIDKVYKNDNNEDILYTEENEVKEQTNLHFQMIAGAINCEKDLSQYSEWQEQYQPKRDVQYTIYSDLMKYLTLNKWIDNVKSLPNNKASSPSGISYKMLKNLNEDNQSFLHAFIYVCMDLNDILVEWKKATIYPIPKLKPFFANLTNTRLITLLKTPQKAFISLLNRRLKAPKIALNKFYGEDTSDETEKLTISSSAYMDNTQWLTPSQNNLEKILEIADSFYKLNNIQVNKEKSELLVRYKQGRYRPKLKPHEPVNLRFGSDSIFIIPVSPQSSICILGVYLDERNTFQSTIKRINDEINELRVIIPRIEYWSQIKVLTKKFMDKIMNRFLSTFKKKLQLLINTSNKIFFNKIYNIKNIGDNQDQAKITNILIQINDASVLEQILSDDGLLLNTNEINDKFNIPNILVLKWYRKVIMMLNTNKDILSSINRIYNTNYINCLITIQQFSKESEANQIRKNYTSKPILLNTDNYPNYYVGTPKKNVDFDTNFFTLEHYNIDSVNNNNKLEISRCQGCNNTTSTYTPLRPRRDQIQESFCNIECNISNTSILYMDQCTTVTRDKYRLIPIDFNSHLHQVINSTSRINLPTIRDNRTNIILKPYSIDKQLLQHFEYNSKLEALHIVQQHLKEEDTLSFYTDGSLINANIQAASMTAGFIRVSDTNDITHSFTTTIENWPSSLRAELFAILLSLIVSPYGCQVDINTDSQNLINIIQRIYNNPTFSIRDYFRLPNNNIVINNIVSIIKAKNLTL